MKVAVKYCGHCNPRLNGLAIVAELRKLLPEIEFFPSSQGEGDVLLVVSGCPVDCATRPPHRGPVVTVAGYSLNGQPVAEDQLLAAIIEALQKFCK